VNNQDFNRNDQNQPDLNPGDDMVDAALATLRDEPVPDGPPQEVFDSTLAALRQAENTDNPKKPTSAFLAALLSRKILTRIAASLLVVAGAAAFLAVMLRSPSTSWSQVLRRVTQARAMSVDIDVTGPGKASMHSRMIMSDDGKMSMDMPGDGKMVSDQAAHRVVILNGQTRSALAMDITAMPASNQPINILDEFKKLTDSPSQDLGLEDIDGHHARKYLVENMGMSFTVWADAQTGLPIRIEIATRIDDGPVTETLSNFVLNPVIPSNAFSMDIPHDYTVREIQVDVPDVKNGEKTIVAALRGYADRTGGNFPTKINDLTEMLKIIKARTVASATGATTQPIMPSNENMKWIVQYSSIPPFLATLSKSDWGYLGAGKTTADKESVIFWYKSSRGYRGVYGDLSVRDLPTMP
jgi:outer membrane lipoprotein-sorting protein